MAPSTWWDPSQVRQTVEQTGPRNTGGPKMIDLHKDSPVGSSINHAIDISCDDGVKSEDTTSLTFAPPAPVRFPTEGHPGSNENVDSKPTDSNNLTATDCSAFEGHQSGDHNVVPKPTDGSVRTSVKRKLDVVNSLVSEPRKKTATYTSASVDFKIRSKEGLDVMLVKQVEETIQRLFPRATVECNKHSYEILQRGL